MPIEIGHYALSLALALSCLQMILPFWGAQTRDPNLMNLAKPVSLGVCGLVALSFGMLTYAYIMSDFSVQNVAENSHSTKPMLYKVTGVWGNHEGSMLLWVLILSLFGALVGLSQAVPQRLKALTLSIQASITIAFLIYILAASNPFLRLDPAPFEGNDLNPVLQDLGLAIHPPLLYFGYVGFSITFAFAAAALIDGRIDAAWARIVRPWTLLAWFTLALGIAMGSYWAYYELGWGGWWFWDPVENASLMPWLAGTALIHSILVMEKREALKVWTILLAILTFSLSLLGTFIVRSGILTSVHAFAVDPLRGSFILVIMCLFIGGGLALFAWRAPLLKQGGLFAPVSREGALVINNLFLATACASVLIGTLYPLALEAISGDKISVGEPYFNAIFVPLALPMLFLIPFGQTLAWKRGNFLGATQRLMTVFALGFVALAITVYITKGGPILALAGLGLGFYLLFGSIHEITSRSWTWGAPLIISVRKAFGLPRSAWGAALAHAGVGITAIGISASAWQAEGIANLKPGDSVFAGPYQAKLEKVTQQQGPNYRANSARLVITSNGHDIGTVETSKRFYPVRQMPTTEAGIYTIGFSQVYASIGEINENGSVDMSLYYKPLIGLIWIGAIVMAFGGALSMFDRRMRLGLASK